MKKKQVHSKEETVRLRITPEEKELLFRAAAADERTFSNWARLQLVKAATEQSKPAK